MWRYVQEQYRETAAPPPQRSAYATARLRSRVGWVMQQDDWLSSRSWARCPTTRSRLPCHRQSRRGNSPDCHVRPTHLPSTHTQLPHDHMSSATTTTSMNVFKQLKEKQLLLSLLSCIAWVVILIVYVHIFVFYVSVCPYIGLTVHLAVLVTHTHPFNGPLSRTTWVSRYQKGKTDLDFTEARDSEWQWHQLDHMQVCISLKTDNHASTPPISFLWAGCPSCHPTNSI